MHNLIIIGSGPAGLTAAIYAARARLQPLLLAGDLQGGQLTTTSVIENFPGFPEGINGPELMAAMEKQAGHFGAEIRAAAVSEVRFDRSPLSVRVGNDWLETRTVIIATGASPRYMGLPREQQYLGSGVSTCATCDGFFYRGKEIAVVGGGDSAMEEAHFLSRFASRITLVHRRDNFRASPIMAQRVLQEDKIAVAWNTVVEEILETPEKKFRGLRLKDVVTGQTRDLECAGVFVAIGHDPNTALFRWQVELDEQGYVMLAKGWQTSRSGVFAAGDVCDRTYRQAVTAAGMGCMAALEAQRYLDALPG